MSVLRKIILVCEQCGCFFETVTNSVMVLRIEAGKHGWAYLPGDKKSGVIPADKCPRCITGGKK